MIYAAALNVGDRFRPAHENQESLNRRRMPRFHEYTVTKVYAMSPWTLVSTSSGKDGLFTIGPGTPVLYLSEDLPTEEEILEFLGVVKRRTLGYRLLWDGNDEALSLLSEKERAVMRVLRMLGKRSYGKQEIINALYSVVPKTYQKSISPTSIRRYLRQLTLAGLIELIVDDSKVPNKLRGANLRGRTT